MITCSSYALTMLKCVVFICSRNNFYYYLPQVAAIKPKMYSILLSTDVTKKTAKGVSRPERKKITHDDYKDCILNSTLSRAQQLSIRSRSHDTYMWKMEKITLNPVDDKRYVLRDGVESLPYYHYKIT
jgi:hypothetical protein